MKTQTRARLKLFGVFLLFAGPLAFAYLLYYGLDYGTAGTNGGVLIEPAIRVPDVMLTNDQGEKLPSGQVFEQKWTILQVAAAGCDQACRQSLDETRQIRALLHRRAARVQRILLTDKDRSLPQFEAQPDLAVYRTDTAPLVNLFEPEQAGAPGMVYLIDPLGNWMLYYPTDGDGEALFKDIKHLLKLSHIG